MPIGYLYVKEEDKNDFVYVALFDVVLNDEGDGIMVIKPDQLPILIERCKLALKELRDGGQED